MPLVTIARDDPDLDRDPQQKAYVFGIQRALRYRGILIQGSRTNAAALEAIEQFAVRPTDVWLATYPKSGNTWTKQILSLIAADGDLESVNGRQISDRVPHLEISNSLHESGHSTHIERLNERPAPRLIATHLPASHIPAQLRAAKAKVLKSSQP